MPNQRLACNDDKGLVLGVVAICAIIYVIAVMIT